MIILGIETTFDETAAAILKITGQKNKRVKLAVLANIVYSQIKKHKKFGGVVPQLAAKLHQKNFMPALERALKSAKIKPEKIDLISVANGPGIIPALLAGVSAAKTLAWGLKKPLVGVNHMEGHIMAALLPMSHLRQGYGGQANAKCQMPPFNRLRVTPSGVMVSKPEMPALALLVSGGHTQLVLLPASGGSAVGGKYKILGETRDDAAGEAFDKVGKMLGLGYPAGAKIEQLAKKGNPAAFNFPRPMIASNDYDFSFSGLKTAVKNTIAPLKERKKLSSNIKADIAASFQAAVIDVLISKTIRAAKDWNTKTLIIGGGVSANKTLCLRLKKSLKENLPGVKFLVPEKQYTNDNAAMIALAGYFRYKAGASGEWEKVQADAELKLI